MRRKTAGIAAWARPLAAATASVLATALPRPAAADRGELQVTASPALIAVFERAETGYGPALVLGSRVGSPWFDWLAGEVTLQWDRVRGLEGANEGLSAFTAHDLSRLSAAASTVLRFGHLALFTVGLGVGCVREASLDSKPRGFVPRRAAALVKYRAAAIVSAGVEWRPADRYALALWGRTDFGQGIPLAEVTGGMAVSFFFWP